MRKQELTFQMARNITSAPQNIQGQWTVGQSSLYHQVIVDLNDALVHHGRNY